MADFEDDFSDLGDLDLQLVGSDFDSDGCADADPSVDKSSPQSLGKKSPGVSASGHLPLSDEIDFDVS
jgi:hypothetical protein